MMKLLIKAVATAIATAAVCATIAPPASADARLPANCATDEFRLQANTYYSSAGSRWKITRFDHRLSGGAVRKRNNVNLQVVSNGRIVYSYASPDALVNDGRRYAHEQTVYVPKLALTHTRFQGIFDIPGFVLWAWGDPYCRGRTLPQLGLPAPLELSLPALPVVGLHLP